MTDPDVYPDAQTKSAMLQGGGQRNRTFSQFWIDGWKTGTLLSYGVDAYGLDGTLYRKLVEMTKEGASPVSQVKDPSSTAAAGAMFDPSVRPAKGLRMPAMHDRIAHRAAAERLAGER